MLASCNVEWFADFNSEQENSLTTEFIFYLDSTETDSFKKALKIGQTYFAADLSPSVEFIQTKLGYDFKGWSVKDDSYENISVDDNNYVKSLKVTFTPYSFIGNWAVSTNTPYFVKHYFENLEDDKYSVNEAYTKINHGTTFTTPDDDDLESLTIEGFSLEKKECVEIAAAGSSECKVYYKRNKHTLTVKYNNSSPDPATKELKYGAVISLEESLTKDQYIFAGWIAKNEDGESVPVPSTMPDYDVTVSASWVVNTNTFYVASTGDDANDGTNEKPFATVQKAVDTVKAMNNINKQPYTVIITTAPANADCCKLNLEYSGELDLTIGHDSAAILKSNDSINQALFNINGNSSHPEYLNVTLKKLEFAESGSISDVAYLSIDNAKVNVNSCKFMNATTKTAILIEQGAKVVLDDCNISMNTKNNAPDEDDKNKYGTGITNKGTLSLKDKNTVWQNYFATTSYFSDPASNILLYKGCKFNIEDDFNNTSEIHFSLQEYPSYDVAHKTVNPIAITSGASETDISDCFICDDDGYTVMQDISTKQVIVTKTLSEGIVTVKISEEISLTVDTTALSSAKKVILKTSDTVENLTISVTSSYGVVCTIEPPSTDGNEVTVTLGSDWPSGTYYINVKFTYKDITYTDYIPVNL